MKCRYLFLILVGASGCRSGAPAYDARRPVAATAVSPAASPAGGGAAPVTALSPSEQTAAQTTPAPTPEIMLTAGQTPTAGQTMLAARPEEIEAAPAESRAFTISDALATGLMQNPDLLTIRGTANVGAAMIDTASVYPWNPFVQAQFLPQGHPFVPATTPGSQAGGSNYYVWLMQRFELGHQRRFREESAIAAFGQTRWNIRQAELLNLAQTERLFFTGLYQRQLRDLAADTETLSRRLVEVVERRFQAGIATTLETANARVAARQAHRQYQLSEAAYQAALLALRQQLGLPPNTPLNLAGDLTEFEWQPIADVFCSMSHAVSIDPQRLAVEMAEARPDVMAARSGAAIARANLGLASAARTPDIQAGPIYSTADNGAQFIGFRVQRDIAVFNNGSALASQRETELHQQVLAHKQLQRRAANEAAAAIDRYERARRFVAEAGGETDESPADELAQVVAQFEAGKADIVNVLGIQNNLLMDLRAELDLINEVAQSAALVTQTTGLPPERLLAPPRPEPLPPAADQPLAPEAPLP
ncbi:MAG TPA: TolC family protein [Pirellulales bacterium]|jgi:multidrug efflux system outer membrane protein|nr:TolC family protein [Pirellulales bacterium]